MTLQLNAQAPDAKQVPKKLVNHNQTRIDNYFWMNERDSKDVLDYIGAENAYSDKYFGDFKGLTTSLLDEFEKRIDPNEASAPFVMNGNTLQFKSVSGKDYQVLHKTVNGKSEVFFDENERAKGKKYYGLGGFAFSPDNSLFAFSEDEVGRRKYTIRVMDAKTKEIFKEEIPTTDGSVVWGNDNKTLYYIRKDEQTLREFQVYQHVLGTKPETDKLIYEEKDEAYYVSISKTMDDAFVMISSFSTTTSETLLLDATKADAKPEVFLGRTKDHLYEVDHVSGGFYICSNFEAPNRKILFSEMIPTSMDMCKEFVPHSKETYLEGFMAFNKQLVVSQKTRGTQQFAIYNGEGIFQQFVSFPESVYELDFAPNDDPSATTFQFFYQSFTTPPSLISYSFEGKSQKELFTKKLRDPNFKPSNYESKRVWVNAADGTRIPVSMVYKKGTDLSKAPLLLYGYGAYGVTIPCSFSATRLSLLDRGFVYAVAHIRGGKFLGEEWYQNGKLLKKRNTFTDFIDVAKAMGKERYCDPSKIYAQGGSAGGLLMGAVANMSPETFKGIVAQVPFVDVMNTMLDETLPLTVGEYEEWGNPNEERSFAYMMSYSPYDNVERKAYPNMYITTGYHDSQVQYWEPLKWIAKLRDLNTSGNKLMFHCTMEAGHGGGSGKTNQRQEIANIYSFILHLEGIEK